MTLSKYERETIIIYNQAEPNAMVYTHDPKLIAKLRRLHDAVPEKVYTDFERRSTVHCAKKLRWHPATIQRR